MSIISLNVEQLKSISSEIETLDNTLVNNYLPDLESELNAIRGNVQGDELHSILNSISSQFSGVKTTLSQSLPKLETFLQEQIKTYGITEEQLKADLSAVLNKMAAYAEENQDLVTKAINAVTDANTVAIGTVAGATEKLVSNKNSDTKESKNSELDSIKAELESLKAQNAELSKSPLQKANDEFLREAGNDNAEFVERFKNDWSNVGEAYQDGLVSGLTNTIGATLTTGANGVGWAYNQIVNSAEWGLGALGLGKGTVGDGLAWLIS